MSDETNIPDNFEEDKELLVEEVQPKEQEQQLPVAEGHETEVLRQQQEQAGGGKKTSTSTPKAIRLATISKLLDKQTTQINKIGQMVQPLQRQLKSVEMRIRIDQTSILSAQAITKTNVTGSKGESEDKIITIK